jgi:hypothetical protein
MQPFGSFGFPKGVDSRAMVTMRKRGFNNPQLNFS